jgi:3-deoxy-D-manno-octulosonic-acid transferase
MFFPKTARKIFKLFDLCLVSNAETKNYLKDLDAKNIFFYGNIKLVSTIDKNKISNRNEEILLKNKFWLAASTHKGEDKMFLDTHLKLKNEYNDIITIIAPRHIDRSQEIKTLSENYNLNTQILNENETISKNKEIVILNSFGILHNYFKYAKSVFIGKSTLKKLRDVGGQNPIDAARLGCKIYHGPYVYNFKEIYELLEKNNVSKKINNFNELSSNLIKDLKYSQKEGNKISSLINNLGQKILTDTMKKINYFLLNEIK